MAKISTYPVVTPTPDDLLIGTNGGDGKTKNFTVASVAALASEGAVASVNGETGIVVLSATDVGADPTGTAAGLVATEASARAGADTTLQANITSEASARASADTTHAALTTAAHGGIVASDDSRLTNARTPTAHASSHEEGNTDELVISENQVTGLVSHLADKAADDHEHTFAEITEKPDTLAGYNITDAVTATALADETEARDTGDTLNAQALADHAALTITAHGGIVADTDSRLTDSRAPTGAAGGVLSGTYPNPSFASDMATQAELDTEASARTAADLLLAPLASPALTGTPTAPTATGGTNTTQIASTAFVASGFQPLDADLTAIAALTTTSYGRALLALADAAAGRTALALGSLAVLSSVTASLISDASANGRSLITAADYAAMRTLLSLGTAALIDTGTGAANVPTITQADARYAQLGAANLFTARQDVRASGSAIAAGLYVPWITGDTLSTIVAGAGTAGNNQQAIQGTSNSNVGVRGISLSGPGVRGDSTTGSAIYGVHAGTSTGQALDGVQNSNLTSTAPSVLALRHLTSGTPAAGFGSTLKFQLQSTTTADQDAAQIAASWTDPTHATRTSVLTFATVNSAVSAEKARLTGVGALWLGKTSGGLTGAGDLDVAGNVAIGGTFTLPTKTANTIFAGPTSGGAATPAFRALVAADVPDLDAAKITTGTLPVVRGGTGVSVRPSFSVHKNGTDQTGIVTATWTKITWPTEVYDTNNNFASNAFTPTVAGTYLFFVSLFWSDTVDLSTLYLSFYKNGVEVTEFAMPTSGTGPHQMSRSGTLPMNGSTDYVEIYVHQVSGSNRTVNGTALITNWSGLWVAP